MAIMIDIDRTPTRQDSFIKVYKCKCVLSRGAMALLGIKDGERVRITKDLSQQERGNRIYISKSNLPIGHTVRQRESRRFGQIDSTSLSRTLSELLEGYGTYRICEEVKINEKDVTYYEIFFKKYEHKRQDI